jgi:uncharacterized protein YcnI
LGVFDLPMKATIVLAIGVCLIATSAAAHVTVWPQQSRQGARERYTVRVPTEGQLSTMSVELEIPPDVSVTGVLATAGYTYDVIRESGRIVRIVWKQEIKPGEVGEFVFFAINPKSDQIAWRARQRLADGTSTEWVGPRGHPRPAASVKLAP